MPFLYTRIFFWDPSIAGVAKVRPAGRMRPAKDFLRPLCQILDASLSNLGIIMYEKHLKFT